MKSFFLCLTICLPLALFSQGSSETSNSLVNSTTYDLVITEIMADPDPPNGLPASEYCEIYNRSLLPVNLNGWIFFDGTIRNLPGIQVDPGEFLIICDDSDTSLFSNYGKCAAVTSISLTNTGEKISLRDPVGNPVDSVIFSDSWFGNSYKKDGGWSLEKVDVEFTCPVNANWKPSENPDGGTPGNINSVAGTIKDEEPPVLLRSFCPDSVSIILVFNEPLDPVSANVLQHYTTSDPVVPASVQFADASLQRIKLQVTSPITPGIPGTIKVNGIHDCSGNEVQEGSQVHFGIGDSFAFNSLIINELMFNPRDGGYDFIELYHKGIEIIDLSKVNLITMEPATGEITESIPISEEPWLLFPGDLVTLSEVPSVVAGQYRSSFPMQFIEMMNFPSMNADQGYIGILLNGVILDSFHYFEDYHFELLEDVKGISLEKINPGFNSADPASWHSAAQSAGFATPGLKNSQYMESVQTGAEVMVSPEIFSPDNDGVDDVITITLKTGVPGYIANTWIYSSDGQIVYDHAKNTHLSTADAFVWDGITDNGVRAPVGIYIAVVEIFNLEGNVKRHRLPFVVATKL
jgi:hypothetical protein